VGRKRWATRISYFALLATTMCAALRKESRMQIIKATGLDRKSGGSPTKAFRFMMPLAATHLIFVRAIFIFEGDRIDTLVNASPLESVGYHPLRAAFTGLGALVVEDSQQMIAAL